MTEGSEKSPLAASLVANLIATLRGHGAMLFGIATLLTLILVVALILQSLRPSDEAKLVVRIGLVLLLLVIIGALLVVSPLGRKPPSTQAALKIADGTSLELSNFEPAEVIRIARLLLQNRRPLPPPHGVVAGNPADESALREYSDQERAAAAAVVKKAAEDRAREVLELVRIETQAVIDEGGLGAQPSPPVSPQRSDTPESGQIE